MSAVALVLTSVISPQIATAAGPAYSLGPPFSSKQIGFGESTGMSGYCTAFTTIRHPMSMNLSNGHFEVSMNSSAHRNHACFNDAGADAVAWLNFYSSNFTVPTSGNHVLRTYWWFNINVTLRSHYGGGSYPYPGPAAASFGIQITTFLNDFSPFGLSFNGITNVQRSVAGNGSFNFSYNAATSIPLPVTLTKGDIYNVTTYAFFFETATAYYGGPNSASARLDLGTRGHSDAFLGFAIH
jgi:hypothetical protein